MKKYGIILLSILLLLSFNISIAFADDGGDNSGGSDTVHTDTEVTILRVSPSDTSGLHALVLTLIGDYNPIVKDYTYITTSYNGSTQTNHSIEIMPDWSWIMTCLLFIVVIYCVFRMFGIALGGVRI